MVVLCLQMAVCVLVGVRGQRVCALLLHYYCPPAQQTPNTHNARNTNDPNDTQVDFKALTVEVDLGPPSSNYKCVGGRL